MANKTIAQRQAEAELAEEAKKQFKAYMWGTAQYTPSALQQEAHDDPRRVKLIAGGIRGGKSYSGAMELLARCATPDGIFWIVGPDYEQTHAEFEYIYAVLAELGLIRGSASMPVRGPWRLETVWGASVETKTSDDVRKLASVAVDGCIMSEAAQQPAEVRYKMMERLLQKNGWLWMCGTFESSLGWYADLFEQWQGGADGGKSFSLPTWSNTAAFPGGRNDPKIKELEEAMPPELFMERCAAIPCKPQGLVHKAFDPKLHIRRLVLNDKHPVELAIDPGINGAYAVLFLQRQGSTVNCLGEVYERGLSSYEIIPKVRAHPLFKYCREGVIDIAAKQRHHAAQLTSIQVWNKLAPEIHLRWHYVLVEQGIDAINLRLKPDAATGIPRLLFDESMKIDRSHDGLAQGVLGEFLSRRWRPYREGGSEPRSPIKANDHALNALGYFLFDTFGPVLVKRSAARAKQRGYWA